MRAQRLLVIASLVLVGASACGGDDDSGSDSTVGEGDQTTTVVEEPSTPAETTAPADTTPAPLGPEAEALAALPWASPDDSHAAPEDTAAGFVSFLNEIYPDYKTPERGSWFPHYENIGLEEFQAGNEGSGTVVMRYLTPEGKQAGELPTTSIVTVRQAGPDGPGWVVGVSSPFLRVSSPAPGAEVGTSMYVSLTNDDIGDPVLMYVFADGVDQPLTAVRLTKRGMMASGEHNWYPFQDLEVCSPLDGFSCEWEAPLGEFGTVVFAHSIGVVTIPIVFGD